MNGPAAEGNLKTGLFTKRDKVKSKRERWQAHKEAGNKRSVFPGS